VGELDQAPGRRTGIDARPYAQALRQRFEPAAGRVGVVGRRVDDGLLLVVLESVRAAWRAVERPLQNDHSGETELLAEPDDGRGDHAEVLGDERHLAQASVTA
jgi:hypothetical protein